MFRYGSDFCNKARIATNLLGIVDHMNSLVCFMFSFIEAEMLYGVRPYVPCFLVNRKKYLAFTGQKFNVSFEKSF